MSSPSISSWALSLTLLLLMTSEVIGDQPIFDEMPRWSGGWGVQLLEEYRVERALLRGDEVVNQDLSEEIHLMHIEGVYTWKKSIRITGKLPIILYAQREQLLNLGAAEVQKEVQEDQGVGDLTLTLPLKKYVNLDGRTASWTFAPQVRIPLSPMDTYEIYDQGWGGGLTLGYETETYRFHGQVSVNGWLNTGRVLYGSSLNVNIGFNFNFDHFSGHFKWKNTLQHLSDGTLTYLAGPTLYFRITDTLHIQAQWKHDFYDKSGIIDHGNGDSYRMGVGVVF